MVLSTADGCFIGARITDDQQDSWPSSSEDCDPVKDRLRHPSALMGEHPRFVGPRCIAVRLIEKVRPPDDRCAEEWTGGDVQAVPRD